MRFSSLGLSPSLGICQGAAQIGYSDTFQYLHGFAPEVMHKRMESTAQFTEIRPREHQGVIYNIPNTLSVRYKAFT